MRRDGNAIYRLFLHLALNIVWFLFRFKISQFVPFLHIFDTFCGFLIKKRSHFEILNLNNRRLVCLNFKGTCYITKKSCTDRGNPAKQLHFWVTSHFKEREINMISPKWYNKVSPISYGEIRHFWKVSDIFFIPQLNLGKWVNLNNKLLSGINSTTTKKKHSIVYTRRNLSDVHVPGPVSQIITNLIFWKQPDTRLQHFIVSKHKKTYKEKVIFYTQK